MSIITEGYGENSRIIIQGYGFITELIVKAKILIEMFKKHLSLSLSSRTLGFKVEQKEIQMKPTKITVTNIDTDHVNIYLEMSKKNIMIEVKEEDDN